MLLGMYCVSLQQGKHRKVSAIVISYAILPKVTADYDQAETPKHLCFRKCVYLEMELPKKEN